MKTKILLFVLLVSTTLFANEQEGGIHTPNYCSVENTCLHLRFDSAPTTRGENQFIIHFLPHIDTDKIENLTAKLWMDMGNGHGHGSAPLKLSTMTEANHFLVTNAYFVMMGPWKVIINYSVNGKSEQVEVPLMIKE